jgi:hypothetical protein
MGMTMSSLREFAAKTLVPHLVEDARRHRIFNEADLQSRTAYHLYDDYVRHYDNLYLLNQPFMQIGKGRGVVSAKPDIVVADEKGPFSAFELKCFLEDARATTIAGYVKSDIDQLRKFKQKYPNSEHTFAVVMVDIPDVDEFKKLHRELNRDSEPWMAHYLRRHVINLYCDENYRKRSRYDSWAEKWLEVHGR